MFSNFFFNARKLALAGIFLAMLPQTSSGAENSAVLTKVEDLLQQKDFYAAKTLLARELKNNKHDWQLWMALGQVFEANEEYGQAIKAFNRAAEFKTGIEGLSARILRLQELAALNPAKKTTEPQPANKALSMLQQAHQLEGQGKILEAGRLFVEAVELDRSLLARDTDLIDLGLAAFKNSPPDPENLFYLGAFYFYAGQYTAADAVFNNYIEKFHDSDKIELARKLLSECREIMAQAIAAQAEASAAANSENSKTKAAAVQGDTTGQTPEEPAPEETEEAPVFTEEFVYESSGTDELPALVNARQKALALLEEYARESDEDTKLGIIWSLGKLRMPVPEVMSAFAGFLESDNVDTIFAALEALEKINEPGAQVCLGHLYKLLGHNDVQVVYRTIKAFSRMPMGGEQVVPKFCRIFQNEQIQARRQAITNAVKAYGQESVTILDAMLKQAERVNKRPIAELLSSVTGDDVETLINNS